MTDAMNPSPVTAEKTALRKQAKARRLEMPMRNLSKDISAHLAQWDVFLQAKTVLAFSPLHLEVDVLGLAETFADKSWFLPRIQEVTNPDEFPGMAFHEYRYSDELELAELAIVAPHIDSRALRDSDGIDLIIVPALLVDKAGYRLGFGKGFYDRFLSEVSKTAATVVPVPAEHFVETVPRDAWDIPVGNVVTENGLYKI